jgi:sugar phosphate isomerase/epimerase
LKRIGVQAGSLRAALTRDFAGTLEQIAAIGFREIELQWYGGNFGRTPEQLRAALDRAGLRATSALIHTGAMLVGWERHLAAAKTIGIEHLAVVNITEDERQSLADCHEWADRFNRAGEIARKQDMWVALHNEPQFMQFVDNPGTIVPSGGEGRTFYDEFIARTDPALVTLELDVGNMTRAGYDPVTFLRKHSSRYRLFHLKDVPPQGQDGDRPLGKGRVDFQRILSAVPNRDAAHFFVEHAVDPAAPIDTMRQSYQHLASVP